MTENVLIAGAGIGGLTAALALHARGIDATVIERTDLRPLGVGINLLPHAVRELYRAGARRRAGPDRRGARGHRLLRHRRHASVP